MRSTVGDRQREARALQQRADVAQIGERRHARRHPAFAFGFRRREGLPQLGQRIAADHRRQQQPVGLQRAADLRQRAWEIVDELKRERGNDEVERLRLQRRAARIRGPADRSARVDRRARASALRTGSPGVPTSAACLNSRSTACSRSAMSSATRSSRNVAGPSRRPRLPRPQQSAVEQDRRGIRVRGHAGLVRRSRRVWQSGARRERPPNTKPIP